MLAKIGFWGSFIVIIYTYFGYPLILYILSLFSFKPINKKEFATWPKISVIIAAKNEELNIRQRIDNLIEQDYPSEAIEIIIVSDGSNDATNAIVETYRANISLAPSRVNPEIHLICQPTSMGKSVAVNTGLAVATGEIVVFADCRQHFAKNALAELVGCFYNPEIGCVTGELIFLKDSESHIQVEMGLYWKYEKWIRKTESMTGSVVGATGAIYAIRRNLFKPLPAETLLDDVITPLHIVNEGHRVVFNTSAYAYDTISKDMKQEWRRKVRTLAGNWQLILLRPKWLLPWCNTIWWRLISHKYCRLIVPFCLPIVLLTSAVLKGNFYFVCLWVQSIFYLTAIAGVIAPPLRKIRLVNLSYFFVALNLAVIIGFWRILYSGSENNIWQKTN